MLARTLSRRRDVPADIRTLCARIDRLWDEGAEDAGDDEGG